MNAKVTSLRAARLTTIAAEARHQEPEKRDRAPLAWRHPDVIRQQQQRDDAAVGGVEEVLAMVRKRNLPAIARTPPRTARPVQLVRSSRQSDSPEISALLKLAGRGPSSRSQSAWVARTVASSSAARAG